MIIKNEIDRIRFIRELQSMELPCRVLMESGEITEGLERAMNDIERHVREPSETQDLGEHPSGMKEDCCE